MKNLRKRALILPNVTSEDKTHPKAARGFTLIEIVMVILITGLLSVAGVQLMRFMIQHTFYLPNQVQTDLAAAEALETMVEGDASTVRGLRYCKTVTAIAPNQVNVLDQDGVALQFRLDTGAHKLYRMIGAAAETLVPYSMPSNVDFSGSGNVLFSFYDGSTPEAVTAVPANVRRIEINLIAQQGAGLADSFQGSSQQRTSIKVNKYL